VVAPEVAVQLVSAIVVGARLLEERAEAIDLVTRVLSMIEDSCHRLLKGMP